MANAETDAPYHALRRVARRPDIPQAWGWNGLAMSWGFNLDGFEEYGCYYSMCIYNLYLYMQIIVIGIVIRIATITTLYIL